MTTETARAPAPAPEEATATADVREAIPENVLAPQEGQPRAAVGELRTLDRKQNRRALSAGIPIRNWEEAWRLAEIMAASDLVPKDYKGKPGNCLVAMQHGAEVGLSPMAAIQNIAVVNGRPAIWGDAIMALCRSHPLYEWTEQWWDSDEQAAYTTMKRRGEEAHTVRFGLLDDAARAMTREWVDKPGGGGRMPRDIPLAEKDTYKQHPEVMCRRRSLARCASFVYADALKGLAPADEVMDYIDGQVVEPSAGDSSSARARERIQKRVQEARPAAKRATPEPTAEAATATAATAEGAEAVDDGPDATAIEKAMKAASSFDELNAASERLGDVTDSAARGHLRKVQAATAKRLRDGDES